MKEQVFSAFGMGSLCMRFTMVCKFMGLVYEYIHSRLVYVYMLVITYGKILGGICIDLDL